MGNRPRACCSRVGLRRIRRFDDSGPDKDPFLTRKPLWKRRFVRMGDVSAGNEKKRFFDPVSRRLRTVEAGTGGRFQAARAQAIFCRTAGRRRGDWPLDENGNFLGGME